MTAQDGGVRPAEDRPATSDTVTESGLDHLIAKLRDPDAIFTGAQVAVLMHTAGRWGYEHRVDEENGAHSDPEVRAFGSWYNQALEREKHDAETRRLLAEERAA